uniref:Uncharacterized protein n=1 Tax=Sicyonia whispovirus TaxID=2984283 RepID=A0A9C7C9E9_9VIRU|nr:MAG: hypothetical protein [Sicyonia whispovirus]
MSTKKLIFALVTTIVMVITLIVIASKVPAFAGFLGGSLTGAVASVVFMYMMGPSASVPVTPTQGTSATAVSRKL